MRTFFRQPVRDVLVGLEPLVMVRNPLKTMVPVFIALLVTWIVYVGIHELLHVLGCVMAGGTVSELQISALYGGAIYAKIFPFVVTGSEYAGRLSGFETGGNDWIYLSCVFMPYMLTVLFGVVLVKLAGRGGRRPILFGVAVVVGLAPFYNVQGDYFEMGSIVVTRALTIVTRGFGQPPLFEELRSDDIFKLIGTLVTEPAELGLSKAGAIAAAVPIIVVSLVVDILLAFATYWVGHVVASVCLGRARKRRPAPGAAAS